MGVLFCFLEMVSCGPDWLQIYSVPQDDLEFMILLPSPSKCWDYRHIPTCLVVGIICGKNEYLVKVIKLSEISTNFISSIGIFLFIELAI